MVAAALPSAAPAGLLSGPERLGELIVAHDQIGLGWALGDLRGILSQKLAHGDAEVLSKKLDFLDGWDATFALQLVD